MRNLFILIAVMFFSFSVTAQNVPIKTRLCAAGGCGAISCEFSGEINVAGSGVMIDAVIHCAPGYFACCHLTAYCFVPGPFECPLPPQ
jgi:hypothetical protein